MGETKPPRKRWRWLSRAAILRLLILAAIFLVLGGCMFWMPGKSFEGTLPALTEQESTWRDALRQDVEHLAVTIGERNVYRPQALTDAADYISRSFEEMGYAVERQNYEVSVQKCSNLIAELPGRAEPGSIVLIGAHYDSVMGCAGADDNASAVAVVLALARECAGKPMRQTVRFVAFVNEEPPFFQTDSMGSRVYAKRCKERGDKITAMIALDGLGFYTDQPDSQDYPIPVGAFYPKQGNFIGFLGNVSSASITRQAIGTFRKHARLPSEGAAVPGFIAGVGWSDHWSFWQEGYDAILVTDTLPFRYEHYHTPQDTADQLDYDRMARAAVGLHAVLVELANEP